MVDAQHAYVEHRKDDPYLEAACSVLRRDNGEAAAREVELDS